MQEYINPNAYTVHLTGPSGEVIQLRSRQKKTLPEYYDKFRVRGFIRLVSDNPNLDVQPKIQAKLNIARPVLKKQTAPQPSPAEKDKAAMSAKRAKRELAIKTRKIARNARPVTARLSSNNQIVGKAINTNATKLLYDNLAKDTYPISNNIGVGILSYNRKASLQRLIESIIANTDLRRTTIFISDDASTDPDLLVYLSELAESNNFVILRNKTRLGIAGNTNRLIRCLSRFNYGLLLNDDVEVLKERWEHFYVDAMTRTGMHHFIYRQEGVYGATKGEVQVINSLKCSVVHDRPHGAVLAFTRDMLVKCGYFDEEYGVYGMEHVDWSSKAWEFKLQQPGFFDVEGSQDYFKLHSDKSAVEDRQAALAAAKRKFETRTIKRCGPTATSVVPEISYVIPFRNIERTNSIRTIIDNIRAQKFPVIHIIMVENDSKTNINLVEYEPMNYYLNKEHSGALFNKSKAFNYAVSKVVTDKVILHDADIMTQNNYTQVVYDILELGEACHLGNTVIYADPDSTNYINSTNIVTNQATCDRVVGYFEGGSIACHVKTFWRCGGFNEDYKGYGCFLPDNYILTEQGYKKIQDVSAQDRLYTHECEFKPIELRRREYSGDVLNIYIPGRLPIKGVTPEHPFLVQVDCEAFKWKKANELEKGDIIASTDFMPELVPSYDLHDITNLDRSQNSFDVLTKMDEFCYLLGLYLAEGVIQTPDKLRIIYYYLDQGEEFIVKHVERLVRELHPGITVNYDYIKNNCREVRVFNSLLAKLIFAVAGKYMAPQKILSTNFVKSRSDRELSFLLGGGCDGDANHNTGSERRLVYHTSSINLAMTYSSIMRRLGIAHSFGKRSGGSFPGSSEYGFDLCVNREFEHIIRSVYPRPPYYGSNSTGKSKFGTIYDIKYYQYSGPVYNFEVEEDHSYVVNGIITHNCEDCDFYARLSANSKWIEKRTFDFLHLWHSRVQGWDNHHTDNRRIEAGLGHKPISERIRLQHIQLTKLGYGKHLTDAS